jgi:hypothetical protein
MWGMSERVFLSYARGDDEPFATRLYEHLSGESFGVWFDRAAMPSRALTFLQEIRNAIHTVDRVVVVLGPRAVASDYVRKEWQYALSDDKIVVPVLRLGDYDLLPPELQGPHCPDARESRDERAVFAELTRILRDPIPPLGRLRGMVPAIPPRYQPRPDDTSRLARAVLVDALEPVELPPPKRVVLLHGMGGAGKSVMAAAFARSTSTRRAFADGVYWVSAGTEAEPIRILGQLEELLGGGAPEQFRDVPTTATRLREMLAEKRALVVVDNLWRAEQIESVLPTLDSNTRLLLTSRDAGLAATLGSREIPLGVLSEEAALRHLADWIGVDVASLPAAACDLARECGYLPFALALNGANLEAGVSWEDLLAALGDADLHFADKKFAGYQHRSVFRSIQVSVDMLSLEDPNGAAHYRELAAFLGDAGIPERAIATLWRARGIGPDRNVRKLLLSLEQKALLRLEGREGARRVKLHDLLRDYLSATTETPAELNRALLDAYGSSSPGGWVNGPNDGYFHQHLIEHLVREGRRNEAHELLALETAAGANAWYQTSEAADNVEGYAADVNRLSRAESPQSADDPIRSVCYQLRYGGVLTTLNSLASNVPAELRTALLRTGSWSACRALTDARSLPDPDARVVALLEMVPSLDGPARDEVLEAVLTTARSRGAQRRAHLLARIAPNLGDVDRGPVIEEALKAARAITGRDYVALAAVLPLLPPERREITRLEAVDALREKIERAGINEGGIADGIPLLAPYLSPDQIPDFLATLRKIPNDFERARAFMLLAEQVEPSAREAVAREGLEIEAKVAGNSLGIFLSLARHLPGVTPLWLLNRALAKDSRQVPLVIRQLPGQVDDTEWKSILLRLNELLGADPHLGVQALIEALPRLPDEERRQFVSRLCSATANLPYSDWRRNAYTHLAPYLDHDQLTAARKALSAIGDSGPAGAALASLLPFVSKEAVAAILDYILSAVDSKTHLDVVVQSAKGADGPERHRLLAAALDAVRKNATINGGAYSPRALHETFRDLLRMSDEAATPEIRAALLRHIQQSPSAEFMAEAFAILADALPQPALDPLIRKILERARSDADELVVTSIRGTTRGSNTIIPTTLRLLAPYLHGEAIGRARELARSVPNSSWRLAAEVYLAPCLEEPIRAQIIAEAISAPWEVPMEAEFPSDSFYGALTALARLTNGSQRALALVKAVAAARALSPSWRSYALLHVAAALDPPERSEIIKEALPAADPWCVHLAVELGHAVSYEIVRQALERAVRANFPSDAIQPLAAYLASRPGTRLYQTLHQLIGVAIDQQRRQFLCSVAALAPLIAAVGTTYAVSDLAQSILRTMHWWP